MTQNDSFRRKIIYISAIAVLLVPLSFISQPATVKKGGSATGGGLLSRMRSQHRLSQAELSDIDPASETMKLATLGLRPVAVTLLWRQIQEAHRKQQWDKLRTSTQTLIALQPNFVKVWEFQAHNLSYNISREFDDYQYRYHWVKEGLSYLMTGIGYNRKDHRILDELGFFFGLKLGRSDERKQFRRLFRKDSDYHSKLADHGIETEAIWSTDLGGADNWLTAYQWYDRSRTMVDNGLRRRTSGIMFYKGAPSQLRNYAIDLEKELRPNDAAREAWQNAYDEWVAYGNREIRTSTNIPVFMDRLAQAKEDIDRMREKLDEMFPGIRDEIFAARRAQMTPEMWAAYNMELQDITDQEVGRMHHMAKGIMDADQDGEFARVVLERVGEGKITMDENQRAEFDRINLEIQLRARDLDFISKYRGTVNYSYWKERCEAESKDLTIQARQALFDARQAVKETRFDEQVVRKPKTNEKGEVVLDENNRPVIVEEKQKGAIQYYEDSFRLWKQILDEHKPLADEMMEDDLVQAMQEYLNNLKKVQVEWPLDFPLQHLVDKRARRQMHDGLPTTDKELAERIEIQKELEKAQQEAEKNKQPMPGNPSQNSGNPDDGKNGPKSEKNKQAVSPAGNGQPKTGDADKKNGKSQVPAQSPSGSGENAKPNPKSKNQDPGKTKDGKTEPPKK